jgi:hypothetical protein
LAGSEVCCTRHTSQLAQGLSQLGRTADGLRSAYLRLDVSGTSLTSPDVIVATHTELQTVNLRDNELSSIASLCGLPHLTSLDVSGNCLAQVCVRVCDSAVIELTAHMTTPP